MVSRKTFAFLALLAFSLGIIATPTSFDFTTLSLKDSAAWAKNDKMKEKKKTKKDKKTKNCSKDKNCNDDNEKSRKGGKSADKKAKGKDKMK